MTAIVIDTNVLLVADGQADHVSLNCRIQCQTRLERIQANEQVVLDRSWLILGEYGNKLNRTRQPTFGTLFIKWLLERSQMPRHVSWVTITPTNAEQDMFGEFPQDIALAATFDPADRKFVAAANAHPEKPPILQSADSKWLDWEQDLSRHGIQLEVICRAELEAIRARRAH